MKQIFLGVYISAILGMAQANALEIYGASPVSYYRYDGQPATPASAANSGPCGSFAATLTDTAYPGIRNGYGNGLSFAFWDSAPTWIGASTVGHGLSHTGGLSHTFRNNDQKSALSFAILNGQTSRDAILYDAPNTFDTHAADAAHDGPVFEAAPDTLAPGPEPQQYVPEPQTIAMLFAGLGLLGLVARRGRGNPFD